MFQVKEALSNETLAKVDLQNHIQSLQEEMAFRQRTHLQVTPLINDFLGTPLPIVGGHLIA